MEVYMIWFHSIWTIMDLHHLFNQMRAKQIFNTRPNKKNAIDLQVLFFVDMKHGWMSRSPKGTDQPTSEAQESSASEEKLSKSDPNKNWN